MKKQVTRYLFIVALLICLFAVKVQAQTVSTFLKAHMCWPQGSTFDGAGNLYVCEANNGNITKITPAGSASLFASLGTSNSPRGIAFDGIGNLCITNYNNVVQKISPAGIVSTFATLTAGGSSANPVFDASGNMYVANSQGCCASVINNLYKITSAGVVSSFAYFGSDWGNGSGSDNAKAVAIDVNGNLYVTNTINYSSTGYISKITPSGVKSIFVPTSEGLSYPQAITIDAYGNLYVSCAGNNTIKKVTPTGVVSTYASNVPGTLSLAFDASGNLCGTASNAGYVYKVSTNGTVSTFYADPIGGGIGGAILGMALDASGNIYTVNSATNTINKITPSGSVSTIASTNLNQPTTIALDAYGNIYAYNQDDRSVTKVTAAGVVSTFVTASAGNTAGFGAINQIVFDASGNLYMSDLYSYNIWKVSTTGAVSNYITLTYAQGFGNQYGLVFDNLGNLYVSTNNSNKILKITPSKSVSVFATGVPPGNLAFDASGNLYVAGQQNNVFGIYKVTTAGVISKFITISNTNLYAVAFGPYSYFNLFTTAMNTLNGNNELSILEVTIPPTIGSFSLANQNVGASPLTITAPTSNSAGAFSYTSSNPSVATVSGSTITILAKGTTTITATQAANGIYATASTSATLTVYPSQYAPAGFNYNSPNIYTQGVAISSISPTPVTSGTITNLGSGFASPFGIAIDASRNLYVGDAYNNAVKKISPSGTVSTILSGFHPLGVAIDPVGNLFVVDNTNNQVKKIATNGTVTILSTGSTVSRPVGLAVDSLDNVYVADGNGGCVRKIAPNGTTTVYASGMNNPCGVALDIYGNVYVADYYNQALKKVDNNGTVTTIVSGFAVYGVTVDNLGNIYVSDRSYNQIKKLANDGSITTINNNIESNCLAVDASGNVYATDNHNSLVIKIAGSAGAKGSYSISPTLPTGLSFNTSTGVISGTPLLGMAATNFTVTATNTVGSTSATFTATVYQYAPTNFTYNSPDTLSAGGATQSPKTVAAGITTTVNSSFSFLRNIAVDAAGNIYAVDNALASIKKITPSGTVTSIGSGFNKPNGVAVDAAGNVYVGDQSNNAVKRIPYSNGTYGSVTSLGGGYSNPAGVAIDANGNVYVADVYSNLVRIVTSSGSVSNIGSGFSRPTGVAVDAAGNVYVADSANNAVKEIPYISSGNYGTPITLGSGFSKPTAIAVDNIFNVYVADNGTNAFKKIASNGTVSTIASGVGNPRGITVDASGNVYLADGATNTIKKITGTGGAVVSYSISPALPAGLTINSATGVVSGTPLAATTKTAYTVTATNTGGTNSTILELTTFVTNTWTGATSTDWGTATNWANNILPTSNSGIIISDTAVNQPVLGTDVSIQGLILNGSLNLNGHNLTLARSQSGSGSILSSGTTAVSFANGTTNSIGKLVVNGGVLTVSGALSITKELDVNAGTLNTGGNITLKSTSITNTAIVGPVGGTINGNVNVERYIPAAYRAYRDMAPELYGAGSIYSNWQEGGKDTTTGIFITGPSATMPLVSFTGTATSSNPTPSADGIDFSINGTASAFNYLNGSWSSITNTTTTNLEPFTGYRLLVRGSRHFNLFKTEIITYGVGDKYYYTNLRMHDATTLRTNGGQLIAGNVTYSTNGTSGKTVSGTSISSSRAALNSTPSGFSMVANPYVSPVLWGTGTNANGANTIFGNSSNINGTFWYLSPTSGTNSNYLAFNALTGSAATLASLNYSYAPLYSSASGYIQPGQAFFVQTALSGSPTVTFTEASKGVTANLYNTFGTSKPLSKIYISLLKQDSATNYSMADGAAIAFNEGFTNNAYGPQDALKISNASDNLFISDKGKNLSIDGRLPAVGSDVLPIEISKVSGKSYQLVVDASIYDANGLIPILKDNYLGILKELSLGIETFKFTVDTTIAASYTNRFSIVFKPTTLAVNSIVAIATLSNKIATISWSTVGENGMSRFEVEKSTDAKSFTKIDKATAKNTITATYSTIDNSVNTTSYYRIKAINEVGTVSYSNVAKVSITNYQLPITLYPNPLKGSKVLNVAFSNISAGKYTVTINNVLGQKVLEVAVSHIVGNGTHAITVNNTLADGIYRVTIRETASGAIVSQSNLSVK